MSATATPRELAELALKRLNRAATDLGLTLPGGRPLFNLVAFEFDVDETDGEVAALADAVGISKVEVYDIELNAEEIEEYSDLATKLEKLAERVTPVAHSHNLPGQGVLPGF